MVDGFTSSKGQEFGRERVEDLCSLPLLLCKRTGTH